MPSVASNCLRLYQGQYLIYVGPTWQCIDQSGDAEFHAMLANDWQIVQELPIPRYPDHDDSLFVYKKRPVSERLNKLRPEFIQGYHHALKLLCPDAFLP